MNHIAIVFEQTFGTGQSLFVRKRELKNTFFKFTVINNSDIFNTDFMIRKNTGNRCNSTGFIQQINEKFITVGRRLDFWQCK